MAYDTESKRVILFGGQTGDYRRADSYNGETWAFDMATNTWTRMKPDSAPSGRGSAELAYDAESDRVIMYGGANQGKWGLDETWAYDYNTNTWTEMAKGPNLHLGGRMTYDAESDRIILFAGYNANSDKYYNDTWAYDFNSDTWTEMTPKSSPGGRNYHAMTYDSKADRVILWGGDVGLEPDADIWTYDYNANKWQEMKSSGGPSAEIEDYPTLAYDTESDQTILYHGKETWAYDYNTNAWKNMVPTPTPRFLKKNALTYSPDADRVVLFGGETIVYSGETWVYDFNTNTWTNVTPQP